MNCSMEWLMIPLTIFGILAGCALVLLTMVEAKKVRRGK